jgi:hypothetical protein
MVFKIPMSYQNATTQIYARVSEKKVSEDMEFLRQKLKKNNFYG